MSEPLRFSANLSWLYQDLPFEQRFEAAQRDGFDALEMMFPYAWSAGELKERARALGQQWVLINASAGDWAAGERGLACRHDRADDFFRSVEQAVHYAQALGCTRVHVLSGTVTEEEAQQDVQGVRRAMDTYIERLDQITDQYKDADVQFLIEPINVRDIPGYLLNTQTQAHLIVDALGKPNLGVQMDLYHCQIMEGDVTMKLREFIPTGHVKHIQIAGVPTRQEPHLGELNIHHLLQTIEDLGYDGHVGCEYRPLGDTSEGLSQWKPGWQSHR